MIRPATLALAAAATATAPAAAQLEFENKGLSGETSLSGSATSGNTESADVGLGLKLRHESESLRHIFASRYDYGSADGEESKNRFTSSYELNWLLNHRLYGFGRGAYENDRFDGYAYRALAGGGLGYEILQGESRTWSVQGGPAYRLDEVEAAFDDMGGLLAPAERQTSVALNLGSRFESQLNDAVSITNETDVTASADTTTYFNSAALTAELMGSVSARFSFDVLHDTSAPIGTEKTDTTTRASLVYSFGGD